VTPQKNGGGERGKWRHVAPLIRKGVKAFLAPSGGGKKRGGGRNELPLPQPVAKSDRDFAGYCAGSSRKKRKEEETLYKAFTRKGARTFQPPSREGKRGGMVILSVPSREGTSFYYTKIASGK